MAMPLDRSRFATAPAAPARRATGELVIPDTPSVKKQLALSGPATTVLDIALGIVTRLNDVPGTAYSELDFLKQCLESGHSRIAVPCALLSDDNDNSNEVMAMLRKEFVSNMSTGNSTPSSPSLSVAFPRRRKKDKLSESDRFPRFPVQNLGEGEIAELGGLMEKFHEWGFDTFLLSRLTCGRPLQFAGWEAFREHHIFGEFTIDPSKAQRFLQRVESMYCSVPYHNKLHAADVTQALAAILGDVGFDRYFDKLSVFSLLLSAMVHDLGHDGRNNVFHVSVRDDLALTYNDRSVQENFHISTAFKLLIREADTNLLSEISEEQLTCIRKQMIECVLGTDMAVHFKQVSDFKGMIERLGSSPDSWGDDKVATDSLQVLLLHSADISNMAKPVDLGTAWTELLKEEFFLQGDEEKERRIPVSPLCDRDKEPMFASSQVGFIQFIVQPTFSVLADLTPRVNTVLIKEVNANIKFWEEQKEKQAAKEAAALALGVPKEGELKATSPKDEKATSPKEIARTSEKKKSVTIGGATTVGEEAGDD